MPQAQKLITKRGLGCSEMVRISASCGMKPILFDGRLKNGDEIEIQTSSLDSPDALNADHWQLMAYVQGPLGTTTPSITANVGAKWMRFCVVQNSINGQDKVGCRIDETDPRFYGRGQPGTATHQVIRAGLTLPKGSIGVDNTADHTWADTGGFLDWVPSLGYTLSCWMRYTNLPNNHAGTQFWNAHPGLRGGFKGWPGNRTMLVSPSVAPDPNNDEGHFRAPRAFEGAFTPQLWHNGEMGGNPGFGMRSINPSANGRLCPDGREDWKCWVNSGERFNFRLRMWDGENLQQGLDVDGPVSQVEIDDGTWHHYMVSMDTTVAGAGNLGQYYLDGVAQTNTDGGADPIGGELLDWNSMWKIQFLGLCGGATQGTSAFSNFWFIPEPIDLSVQGNREEFYLAGAVPIENSQTGAITFPTGGLKTPAYWFPSGNPSENRGSVGQGPMWQEMNGPNSSYLYHTGPVA